MKYAVSISLGSSKRDKRVEVKFKDEIVVIERIGLDGDAEKAKKMFEALDGQVDAFGMGGVDMYPQRLPDIYAGEPLIIMARSEQLKGNAVVTGQRASQPWQATLPLNRHTRQPGVGVLWARSRIAALMDSMHDSADLEPIRTAVIETALRHHLVSKFTSLVAVDVTPTRPADSSMKRAAVPSNLPHGMLREKVFGVPMTQTATTAPLHMLTGLVLLIMVLLLYWYSSGWFHRVHIYRS